VILAALLPDADGVLGWVDPALYAKYHRVATHSVLGMVCVALLAAFIARRWPQRVMFSFARTKVGDGEIVQPSFRRLAAFSSLAAAWHWVGDWVAAWGIWPLWPLSGVDVSLRRVNSLDMTLLLMTLGAWAVQNQLLGRGRRRAGWLVAWLWLAACAAYVWLRPYFGEAAFV
jgi:membrane-bound metal-dependent hydrolase YbcI (DUF457 family)